ncbi:hypothetical protein P879_11085 [Paragonimus westermani]|uniref:MARVEL domain-containing protein n=1 Tax=Paragonimus westermani TaxID=34504 RepID=A0A8T0D526_9TREM|nr:hypothetical protein P879_11085 [Paragonimus westermani]
MRVNAPYAKTIPGIFKLVETVLNITIIVLVAFTDSYRGAPAGCILFVSVATTLTSAFFYITHLTNLVSKFVCRVFIVEFAVFAVITLVQTVCMVLSAATSEFRPTIIAVAVSSHLVRIYPLSCSFLRIFWRSLKLVCCPLAVLKPLVCR